MLNKIISFSLLAGIILGFSGCEEYLDINDDPNNPNQAPITGLMANVSLQTGDNVQSVGAITSFYVQYLASPNEASSTDVQEPVSYNGTWRGLYSNMTDIKVMIQQARESGATDYEGVGNILLAINLGLVTQLWGDVPYSEAFTGENLNPVYDDDQEIYTEIQDLLDAGISLLGQESSVQLGEDDFVYEGDTDLWVKAAYALKARYAIHLTKTSEFNSDPILNDFLPNAFASGADDASVSYYTENRNPWANVAIANAGLILGGWISEQLVQAMDGTTFGVVDPRLPQMMGTTDEGEYVGTTNGAGRGDAAEQGERSYLVTGTYYSSELSPLDIITYSELKFIEAEAALRGGDNPVAYEAYLEGINSHIQKIGIADSAREAYVTDPAVAVGASNLTLDLIFKEKYVALFLNPETWVDARRNDYDYTNMTVPVNQNPELGGDFIRRLAYPDSEITRNTEQVPAGVDLLDRVWWDN